ncbi:VPLPA-CTERM sorting domain-containing protein [uncultured Roseobacter sp.]|uniref:VPLPA-CTERM sorting domain-containing protein n=1 Tax=uncultured Roseobacter sp. TaxID=114847 RepID=UPI00260826BA|nr:VPLPA-CTERM sorting domain-containing protein [uncultured Roseobacter sp.]
MKRLLSLTAAALVAASTAQAALIANISGTPGSGQTTWTFSGTTIAGRGAFFQDGNLNQANVWTDLGDYTSVEFFNNVNVSGDAALTIDGETRRIDLAAIDDDGDFDDWGIGVDGADIFVFGAGSEVSWTGSLTVFGIDLNDLNNSGLPITFLTSSFGLVGEGTLDLELTIAADEISAVPLPAGGVLLLSGLAGVAALRRRKKSIT